MKFEPDQIHTVNMASLKFGGYPCRMGNNG